MADAEEDVAAATDASSCCFVYLRLPDAFIQIERRMTPALATEAAAAFVLYVPGAEDADARPPLAISPAARHLGLAADTPLGELRRRYAQGPSAAVRFVPAASWAAKGGGTTSAAEEAYRRVAEQGPWALVKRVVEAEGLALRRGEDGGGEEERWVRVPGGGMERARALALDLEGEVRRLLGYELRTGVAPDVENARREARGLMLLPRPRKQGATVVAAASATASAQPPASPSPSPRKKRAAATSAATAAAVAEAEAEQGEGEVEVAEYFCSVCRAFFFESTALLAHVQAHHHPSGAGGGESAPAGIAARADATVGLEGPGQVSFSEALAHLTDPAAIEAFLVDLGVAGGSGGGIGGGGTAAASAESFPSPSR